MPDNKQTRNSLVLSLVCSTVVLSTGEVQAQSNATASVSDFFSSDGQVVTKEAYPTVESARQMLIRQERAGGVNKFFHKSVLTPTDEQPVVRMNRDSYYSTVVVDVSNGATVTLPELPAGMYISMQPVTEDHRIQPMSYGGGTFELATHTGDHVYVIVRLDSRFTAGEAAQYQSQMSITAGSSEMFTAAPVDKASFDQVELELKASLPDLLQREGPLSVSTTLFSAPTDGSRAIYTPEKNQIAAAIGWGGAQAVDNIYETSPNFPAEGCYDLTFEDPGNRYFWSITVYNKAGFMFDDKANVNSYGAKANPDGTYTVSLGCDEGASNRIPIKNASGEFGITARHYGPSERVEKDGYRLTPLMKKVE